MKLCQAAWAASHTKDTYLSAFYRRLRGRKGEQKAVLALAHHLITVVYNVVKRREEYVELGGDYYDRENKPRVISQLVARLKRMGLNVTLTPMELDEPVIVGTQVVDERPAAATTVAVPKTAASDTVRSSGESTPTPKRKRGRPCKCVERGIICKHGVGVPPNLLERQGYAEGRFS